MDLRNNVQLKDSRTCILFLIHLPRSYPKSNFVSFQEHPWICYHIDEVISYTNSITITDLVITDYSIAEVFASSNLKPFDFNDEIHLGHGCNKANYDSLFQTLLPYQQKNLHLCKQLHHFIPEAVILSKLKKDRIEVLQKIIPETSTTTGLHIILCVTIYQYHYYTKSLCIHCSKCICTVKIDYTHARPVIYQRNQSSFILQWIFMRILCT